MLLQVALQLNLLGYHLRKSCIHDLTSSKFARYFSETLCPESGVRWKRKGGVWQGPPVAYLAGTKRAPQSMTAAIQPERSRRRASNVLVSPLTCLSSPDPEDPDLLRC